MLRSMWAILLSAVLSRVFKSMCLPFVPKVYCPRPLPHVFILLRVDCFDAGVFCFCCNYSNTYFSVSHLSHLPMFFVVFNGDCDGSEDCLARRQEGQNRRRRRRRLGCRQEARQGMRAPKISSPFCPPLGRWSRVLFIHWLAIIIFFLFFLFICTYLLC